MPLGPTEAARRTYNWNQVRMDDRLESPFRPFAFMLHMVIKRLLVVEIRLPVETLFELGGSNGPHFEIVIPTKDHEA